VTHWIATIGAPRGHRVRFTYSATGPMNIRTLECECGWKVTYRDDKPRGDGIAAHARHCDLVRLRGWPDPQTGESLALVREVGPERFESVPHPAELAGDQDEDER
jgi:hypothetical protein